MRRLAAAALAASFTFLALGGAAGAQDNPPPPSYLPDPQVRGLPASKYQLVLASEDCKLDLGNNAVVGAVTAAIPGSGAVVGALPGIPAPSLACPGNIPKDGVGKVTQLFWSGGVTIVSIMTDGVEALLAFDIASLLAPAVDQISQAVQVKIADRLQLGYFAVAFAAILLGVLWAVGQLGRVLGELARIILALGIAGLILTNVSGFYRSMSDFGREASSAGLGIAGDSQQHPLDPIRDALIWSQWQGVQFDGPLPPECAEAAQNALRDDKSVIKSVDAAGCHDEAKRAVKPSWKRFWGAFIYFVLAVIIAWQIFKLGFGIAAGQVALALSMGVAPIACAVAPFRWSRPVFAIWLAAIGKFLVGMIFAALVLAIEGIFLIVILGQPWDPLMCLVVAALTAVAIGRVAHHWVEHAEQATHRSTTAAIVGGAAVGAAGAVAAQGIVSSSHARASGAAARARGSAQRTVGRTAMQAGGQTVSKAAEAGKRYVAATPAAQSIQDRREARHRVDREEGRERVREAMVAERERRNRPASPPRAHRPPQPQKPRRPLDRDEGGRWLPRDDAKDAPM